jgi:hypothetical protein
LGVLPLCAYFMRTMNTPLHPLLLEIARLANVTPQEAMERILDSVLEQANRDEEVTQSLVDICDL